MYRQKSFVKKKDMHIVNIYKFFFQNFYLYLSTFYQVASDINMHIRVQRDKSTLFCNEILKNVKQHEEIVEQTINQNKSTS